MELFVARSPRSVFGMMLFVLLLSEGHAEIQIPAQADWTNRGTAISAGNGWDTLLGGAISPGTVIKKNGTFFLYYVGSDGVRSTDGGPRRRALGVATSTDGINFTKYSGNPIITHIPHNNQEEGVFSAAATLDDSGNVVLYYGAIWAANSTTTSVDVYVALATSSDGLTFNDRGASGEYVYKETNEEVEPIGVVRNGDTWYVYYINNAGWRFNLLSGPAIDNLSMVGAVSGTGGSAKGGGDPILLNATDFVSFVDHYDTRDTLVMTGSLNNPQQLTQIDRYTWGGSNHKASTTFLDTASNTWFMYYHDDAANSIGVRTAPVVGGISVDVPPKAPENLTAD